MNRFHQKPAGIKAVVIAAVALSSAAAGCGRREVSPIAGERSWEEYRARHALSDGPDAATAKRTAGLPAEPSLEDCQAYAALHSPALEAEFHAWRAAMERIPQARALPDPMFTYEVEIHRNPREQVFKLEQMFPWFGKLELRGQVAVREAAARWQRFQAARLDLRFRVIEAWCEYYYLGRALAVTRESLALLEQMEELVRTRYKAAAASHPDLVRLQVEIGKLSDQVRTLEQLREPAAAKLDAAMGRRDGPTPPWPADVPYEPLAASPPQVLETMKRANPDLLAMDEETAAARQRIDLARKDYFPDVTLGASFTDMMNSRGMMSSNSDDRVMGMVSLNIPIWLEKLAAGVREARSRHFAVLRSREQKADDLSAQARMALYELQDAQRKIDLYSGTLIPKARESLKVTQAAFVGGTSGFTDMIDAERTWLEFELMHQRARADHAIRRAALEQIVGEPLPTEQAAAPADSVGQE